MAAREVGNRDIDFIIGAEQFGDDRCNAIGIRRVAIDEIFQCRAVVRAGEQFAGRRRSITSSAADFLHVAFIAFGHVIVIDVADVGLIYAHAKRNRGANDRHFTVHKRVLSGDALLGFHARVVSLGVEACFDESFGDLFGMALQADVNDGGSCGALAQALH